MSSIQININFTPKWNTYTFTCTFIFTTRRLQARWACSLLVACRASGCLPLCVKLVPYVITLYSVYGEIN